MVKDKMRGTGLGYALYSEIIKHQGIADGVQQPVGGGGDTDGAGAAVRYDGVREQSIAWGGTNAGAYLVLGPPRDTDPGAYDQRAWGEPAVVEGTLLGGWGTGL